jgi:anti-sigma B factor antagonist
MPLSIETTSKGKALVAKIVADSLETDKVASFRSAMAPILDKSIEIVLDLSQINFMDSTGLGAMLSCLRTVKGKGGHLKLFNLTPEVRQLF